MANRYDIEQFMTEYLVVVRADIVTKLDEITTSKGDGLDIPPPDAAEVSSWSTFGLPESLFNNPVWGLLVENGAGEAQDAHGHAVAETVIIANVIGFQLDANEDEETVRKKLQRYRRALKEIAEEKASRKVFAGSLKITAQTPLLMEKQGGETYHLTGITMEVTIA